MDAAALTGTEIDALLAAAEAAVAAAAAVIRPLFRNVPPAELKSDHSPVTIADRAAERAMRDVLATRFPDHAILGEEYGETNAGARLRWVLDPIDGTRAFITGRPLFGTLVGLLDNGRPLLGMIDQPVTGERWTGITGRRTVFRGGFGGTIGCRRCATVGEAELGCTSPLMFGPADTRRWQRLAEAAARASFGGDCYGYGLLALGHIDIIAEADLKLWDWAALVPVIEGAGGRMTDWHGATLHEGGDGRALAVGDPALLKPVVDLLGG